MWKLLAVPDADYQPGSAAHPAAAAVVPDLFRWLCAAANSASSPCRAGRQAAVPLWCWAAVSCGPRRRFCSPAAC
jgi:hypothetical protein